MQITRCAAMVWSLAAVLLASPVAWAQQSSPPGTPGAPTPKIGGSWPTVFTPSPPAPTEQLPPEWSAQDVEAARARCAALLKGLDVVAVPIDPIREGASCGAPAPMQLISIGSNPPISFSPPALLTCDMIVALHKWVQRDLQPLARKHLGAPVVGVKTMSSFSCRNAYGRAKTRLSEHGRVNALDLGAFLTAQGETAVVVADWGPTAREIAAKVIDAQAEAIKRQAEAVASNRKGSGPDAPKATAPPTVKTFQATTTVPLGIPGITLGTGPSSDPTGLPTGLGWAPPSRLGGPKDADATEPGPPGGKAAFLRAVHKAACTIFSTVLGPEANKAHKNHFHLDMAERKNGNICE